METTKSVYKAINNIQAELAKVGISKDRKNQQQGYAFRGIDDIYGALAPLLAKFHLVILPRCLEREEQERTTAKGGVLFYVTVKVEYDIVSSDDGSIHVCSVYGQAMDSADKATNKAMSAAYKYMCLQTFCIPTEGDNDADETTPDTLQPKHTAQPAVKTTVQPVSHTTVLNNDLPSPTPAVLAEIQTARTIDEIKAILKKYQTVYNNTELARVAGERKQFLLSVEQIEFPGA